MINSYLLLGSNIGDKRKHLQKAVTLLSTIGKINTTSNYYGSEAWGEKEQHDFINQAIVIKSAMSPYLMLDKIQSIEQEIGREKTYRWGPRVIDIDILLYGDIVMDEDRLTLPHRLLTKRMFALLPLSEVYPDICVPGTEKTIKEHLVDCQDKSRVWLYENE